MRWISFILFFLLTTTIIPTSVISSGSNQNIQRKIEDTRQLQRQQTKKFQDLLKQLEQNLKNQQLRRRIIPDDVRIPRRKYRYKK